MNGDGKADIVGFGERDVFVALSTGHGFKKASVWYHGFTYRRGNWRVDRHPRLLADVNGDGKADIVGFGNRVVYVALSTGHGFQRARVWYQGFTYQKGGWRVDRHPRLLADVNGDGKADIVGFGERDVFVALSGYKSKKPLTVRPVPSSTRTTHNSVKPKVFRDGFYRNRPAAWFVSSAKYVDLSVYFSEQRGKKGHFQRKTVKQFVDSIKFPEGVSYFAMNGTGFDRNDKSLLSGDSVLWTPYTGWASKGVVVQKGGEQYVFAYSIQNTPQFRVVKVKSTGELEALVGRGKGTQFVIGYSIGLRYNGKPLFYGNGSPKKDCKGKTASIIGTSHNDILFLGVNTSRLWIPPNFSKAWGSQENVICLDSGGSPQFTYRDDGAVGSGHTFGGWRPVPNVVIATESTVIKHAFSNLAFDVPRGHAVNGTRIQVWSRHGATNQQWFLRPIPNKSGVFQIVSATNRACLDLKDGQKRNGAPVQLWQCFAGNTNQEWIVQSQGNGYWIKLDGTNLCLDLTDGRKVNGNKLQVWSCGKGNHNQIWQFVKP